MRNFGGLAAERLESLAGHSAESGRLARGRALFRKGSVLDLSVDAGAIIAQVRGSGGDLYDTVVASAPASRSVVRQVTEALGPDGHGSVDQLISDGVNVTPRVIDLAFTCSCADWEEPCKHAIAVLLAFAQQVDLDAGELLLWRGIDATTTGNGSTDNHDSSATTGTQAKGNGIAELRSLLGDTAVPTGGRGETSRGEPSEPPRPPLSPVFAEFLGLNRVVEPPDLSSIPTHDPAPFDHSPIGPLAELAPELNAAIATIAALVEDPADDG